MSVGVYYCAHFVVENNFLVGFVRSADRYKSKCHVRCVNSIFEHSFCPFEPFGRSIFRSPMPIAFIALYWHGDFSIYRFIVGKFLLTGRIDLVSSTINASTESGFRDVFSYHGIVGGACECKHFVVFYICCNYCCFNLGSFLVLFRSLAFLSSPF